MLGEVVLVLSCLLQRTVLTTEGQNGTNPHVFYAVQMDGGIKAARSLAKQQGLHFIQQIGSLEGLYTLRDSGGRPDRDTFENRLATAAGVLWVQRQCRHYREKRVPVTGWDQSTAGSSPRRETDRRPEENLSDQSLTFNDPLWPMQWELFAQGMFNSSGFDLNVMPVWRNNITGRGVVVSIIDDGIGFGVDPGPVLPLHAVRIDRCQTPGKSPRPLWRTWRLTAHSIDHTNKDLKKNFEALASFDLCASHGLSHDPMPIRNEENSHGTRCAGEVAMEANNSYCGVGIAFNARIGGIRLLAGSVTDAMEATALTFNIHFIDIYVCSWGPRDNGAEMDGPHRLTGKALRFGAHKGRGGKGSIFVWAAGNGGMMQDHCGADGYVNSIYTIAIGAVSQMGKTTYFGEPCPGLMAVTLTGASVGGSLPLVTVTNVGDGCVKHFPGTSSAAPIAAGILALVLEVNPTLTWRDVQHLIAKTAKIPDPKEPGWNINAEGYHVHHRFGFGLLDAGRMVQQATLFNNVAPQRTCTQEVPLQPTWVLRPGGVVTVNIPSEACHGTTSEINTLEHVQVRVSISSMCRGDLSISLRSPAGTVSLLLDKRPNDASTAGLKNWTLMTVHSWGEHPRGLWIFKVTDHKGTVWTCKRPNNEASGAVLNVTLILYGTYHPHRSTHEGPLQSFVSMGSRHPIPHKGVYPRDSLPPLDLIHWIYQMERSRKVQIGDINVPARQEVSKEPGNSGLDDESLKKPLASSMAFQLQQTDDLSEASNVQGPAVKTLHETKTVSDYLDREKRFLPSQLSQGVITDVKTVRQSDSTDPSGGETVRRKAEGTGERRNKHEPRLNNDS